MSNEKVELAYTTAKKYIDCWLDGKEKMGRFVETERSLWLHSISKSCWCIMFLLGIDWVDGLLSRKAPSIERIRCTVRNAKDVFMITLLVLLIWNQIELYICHSFAYLNMKWSGITSTLCSGSNSLINSVIYIFFYHFFGMLLISWFRVWISEVKGMAYPKKYE